MACQKRDMQSNLKENKEVMIKREKKASKRYSRSRHAIHTLERTALRLLQLFLWRPLGGHGCTSNTQHEHIPLAMPLGLADTLQITVKWQETSLFNGWRVSEWCDLRLLQKPLEEALVAVPHVTDLFLRATFFKISQKSLEEVADPELSLPQPLRHGRQLEPEKNTQN